MSVIEMETLVQVKVRLIQLSVDTAEPVSNWQGDPNWLFDDLKPLFLSLLDAWEDQSLP